LQLKEAEWTLLGRYNQLSTDYMDKIFAAPEGSESVLTRERRVRREKRQRGRAINKLVAYFGELTGEEGKSLKYFLIWKMYQEEELSHREIAEILDVTRARITQIIIEIKEGFEKNS
jgi:hypothetical protein